MNGPRGGIWQQLPLGFKSRERIPELCLQDQTSGGGGTAGVRDDSCVLA